MKREAQLGEGDDRRAGADDPQRASPEHTRDVAAYVDKTIRGS
jgi:hypothetical protein